MKKSVLLGIGIAGLGVLFLVKASKGSENGGNGIIPGPITFDNFAATDFTIRADSGWWGVNYIASLTYSFTYYTEVAIPEEPSNKCLLRVGIGFADVVSSLSATPTTDYIGPFQFPAGTTRRTFPMEFTVGKDQNPYVQGDIVPVFLSVQAEADSEILGGRTFTGEVQCLG